VLSVVWGGRKILCEWCGKVMTSVVLSESGPQYPVTIVCTCRRGTIFDSDHALARRMTRADLAELAVTNPREHSLLSRLLLPF
jgi:hypothetical protein